VGAGFHDLKIRWSANIRKPVAPIQPIYPAGCMN
jgi:hypothetical protein